jgi:hypothetical protein
MANIKPAAAFDLAQSVPVPALPPPTLIKPVMKRTRRLWLLLVSFGIILSLAGAFYLGVWYAERAHSQRATVDPPVAPRLTTQPSFGGHGRTLFWVQITYVTRSGGETTPSSAISRWVRGGEALVVEPPKLVDHSVEGWCVYMGTGGTRPGHSGMFRYGDIQPLSQPVIVGQSSEHGPTPPLENTAYRR